jgi:hypothetical protein
MGLSPKVSLCGMALPALSADHRIVLSRHVASYRGGPDDFFWLFQEFLAQS